MTKEIEVQSQESNVEEEATEEKTVTNTETEQDEATKKVSVRTNETVRYIINQKIKSGCFFFTKSY